MRTQPLLRRTPPWFLSLMLVLAATTSGFCTDVSAYFVLKGKLFSQLGVGAPAVTTSRPYRFNAIVIGSSSNSVISASVQSALSGFGDSLMPDASLINGITHQSKFTNQVELDAAYPPGMFVLSIVTRHDGTKNLTLPLTGDSYPASAPHINNYSAAQEIDSTKDFALTWDPLPGGTSTDFVLLQVQSQSGLVYLSPMPGQPGTLNGQTVSAIIPANSLAAGQQYLVTMTYLKATSTDPASYPGAVGTAGFYVESQFTILTTAFVPSPPHLVAVGPNALGQFQLQLIGPPNHIFAIQAASDLRNPTWTQLTSQLATNTSVNFTDTDSTNFPQRWYRGIIVQ